jgi:hypothetical protein
MGLYDMLMIKDNHVTAAGSVTQAIGRAEQYLQAKVILACWHAPHQIAQGSVTGTGLTRHQHRGRDPHPGGGGGGPAGAVELWYVGHGQAQ